MVEGVRAERGGVQVTSILLRIQQSGGPALIPALQHALAAQRGPLLRATLSGMDTATSPPTEALRDALLAWYRAQRRDLPWRATRDPYAVWVSEAMLQQTRVETAEPYWRRFMERFPTIAALAGASEDEVLVAWSGLGYYRRARALRAAAQQIRDEHGGTFPRDPAQVLALPGVGRYTAGAVLSIAFDLPQPVVDGNVTRVFARLFLLEGVVGSPALERRLWELAESLVPTSGGAGDWNQAVMELGATICTPRAPACGRCPLATHCAALGAGRVAELPHPKPRPETLAVELEVLHVVRDASILLELRPPGGRMAGLWQLPSRERPGPDGGTTGLFPERFPPGWSLCAGSVLGEVRHTITRHRIRARVLQGRRRGEAEPPQGLAWCLRSELAEQPLTGMTAKILGARFLSPSLFP